ncbi:acetolactate synthase-1/3 small subunit [Aureibacter tunicatorum]|uniref:Acetolactate synthase small subunit n=2 Tax=Aureibacter tunicatorum TaxID=866807 RepID=A0AAE3XMC5_9BACT|nr:acetolactate synthase-1/3 small subunit [Aureibacter tunicatorum]
MNIESITTAKSEIPGISRYNIVVETNQLEADKINLQIEKQIEVIKSLVSTDTEIIHREVALYKLENTKSNKKAIETIISSVPTSLIAREEKEYIVVQNTGREDENESVLEKLSPLGVREFSRSGRICVMKAMDHISEYIQEI